MVARHCHHMQIAASLVVTGSAVRVFNGCSDLVGHALVTAVVGSNNSNAGLNSGNVFSPAFLSSPWGVHLNKVSGV